MRHARSRTVGSCAPSGRTPARIASRSARVSARYFGPSPSGSTGVHIVFMTMFLWSPRRHYCIPLITAQAAMYQYNFPEATMTQIQTLMFKQTPLPPLSRLMVTLALTVVTWETRYRSRQSLRRLPPHMLRDIGLNVDEAEIEIEKPFWRGRSNLLLPIPHPRAGSPARFFMRVCEGPIAPAQSKTRNP